MDASYDRSALLSLLRFSDANAEDPSYHELHVAVQRLRDVPPWAIGSEDDLKRVSQVLQHRRSVVPF